MAIEFELNGVRQRVDVDPQSPLLWVLRETLALTGTKYGCGLGQCGACTVLVDDRSTFACQLPVGAVAGRRVTTIEGVAETHAVKRAWIAEQVPQCGYCQSGQILRAVDLLDQNARPTRADIVEFMSTNLCRCGTYLRIVRAIERAAGTVAPDA